MEKGKQRVIMEEICEDRCFACKGGGGSLLICELKNCPKAYHAECAGKDKSLLESGGCLPCKWHSCFICDDHSKYQCYCCPRAVCERCIVNAEFAMLRGTKGFCINCIKVLLPAEKHKAADSEGLMDKLDLKNINTSEGLLYEYWLIVKGKENLTLKHLCSAYDLLKSGEIHTSLSNPSGSDKYGYGSSVFSSGEMDTGSEFSIRPLQKGGKSNDQKASKKRQVKSKKLEYIDWGSKPLINFLVSIGKDTCKEISQLAVESIINKYIKDNHLADVKKKKKIVCDESLNDLFGKKTFMRNSIYKLLELHYRKNAEFLEQDQQSYNSEEENEKDSNLLASKKQKKTDEFINPKKEVVTEAPRSCFASVVADNIKLVYLTRSVVMELLEEPETFESLVIGSFVKVKSHPYDYMQKNFNQLVQVIGVKNTSQQEKKEDIFLQVSNRCEDFPISKLLDGNFSEEECDDLRKRVKTGQLRKMTLVKIEDKAKSLHQVITKHWIVRELNMLQNKIDRANEKGWRAELFEFLERRELLKTEAEQKRLLEEVPKVIAEVLETDQELKQGDDIPPISISTAKSGTLGNLWEDDISSSGNKADVEYNSLSGTTGSISANYGYGTIKGDVAPRNDQDSDEEESDCNDQSGAVQRSEPRQRGSQVQSQSDDVEQKSARAAKVSPIELSSDDDNSDCSSNYVLKKKTEDLIPSIWHYLGPKGEREIPFSMLFLKHWGKTSLCFFKFEAWKTGENEEKATRLSSVVKCKFTDLLGNAFIIFLLKS